MNSIKRGPFNMLSEFGNLERFDKTIMRIHPLRRVLRMRLARRAARSCSTTRHPRTRYHLPQYHSAAVDAVTFDNLSTVGTCWGVVLRKVMNAGEWIAPVKNWCDVSLRVCPLPAARTGIIMPNVMQKLRVFYNTCVNDTVGVDVRDIFQSHGCRSVFSGTN